MIDWHQQWALHAPNFQDGFAHIELKPGTRLRLKPGPGFGDLSHVTTRLVLKMMKEHVSEKTVIDLGCGSGILSLCAALLGASEVHGIDICEEAILHARENAKVNELTQVYFGTKARFKTLSNMLLLINMISSEQESAWKQHPYLHGFNGLVISSGILADQKTAYLAQAAKRGWIPLSFQEEEGWLSVLFSSNSL